MIEPQMPYEGEKAKRRKAAMAAEYEVTAYVTVTIPVSLIFPRRPSGKLLKKAAIENLITHPALYNADDLAGYVDKIATE